MTVLTIATLMKICEKLPPEYEVKIITANGKIIVPGNTIEVDITNQKLILKE